MDNSIIKYLFVLISAKLFGKKWAIACNSFIMSFVFNSLVYCYFVLIALIAFRWIFEKEMGLNHGKLNVSFIAPVWFPLNTWSKLKVHKTFRRCAGRLLNVLCNFNFLLCLKNKTSQNEESQTHKTVLDGHFF